MQKLKRLFAAPAAALVILAAAPTITATQVATTVAVPIAVTALAMTPTKAEAGLVLSEDSLGPWARFRNWLNGLVQ